MEPFSRINEEYCAYYGIRGTHSGARPSAGDRVGEPTAVWSSERNAREVFEAATERILEERGRLLSPHFVGALENLDRARLFLLAYAADLVQPGQSDLDGTPTCKLLLPEAPLDLLDLGSSASPVAPEVIGMHNFVLDSTDPTLIAQPNWDSREQLLHTALKQLPPVERAQRWKRFEERCRHTLDNNYVLGLADLVVCARILVSRMLRPQDRAAPASESSV
jgi:hypothetical protein